MKFNWNRNIKTRKGDKRALILLAIALVMLYAYTFYHQPQSINKGEPQTLHELLIPIESVEERKQIVKSVKKIIKRRTNPQKQYKKKPYKSKYPPTRNFKFDPNKLDSLEWLELGVRPWVIKSIMNYQKKGGSFRNCEDLSKIYNLHDSVFNRIVDYCSIAIPPPKTYASNYPTKKKRSNKVININSASAAELESLWGVGPFISKIIVERREKLGGFHNKAQLSEIYGLTDSFFLMNKKRLHITAPFRYININGEQDSLSKHYNISYSLAKLIVRYRRQHGDYQHIEDLKKLVVMNDSLYLKLEPYLKLE